MMKLSGNVALGAALCCLAGGLTLLRPVSGQGAGHIELIQLWGEREYSAQEIEQMKAVMQKWGDELVVRGVEEFTEADVEYQKQMPMPVGMAGSNADPNFLECTDTLRVDYQEGFDSQGNYINRKVRVSGGFYVYCRNDKQIHFVPVDQLRQGSPIYKDPDGSLPPGEVFVYPWEGECYNRAKPYVP